MYVKAMEEIYGSVHDNGDSGDDNDDYCEE